MKAATLPEKAPAPAAAAELERVKEALQVLPVEVWDDRDQWQTIGLALHTLGTDTDTLLDCFIVWCDTSQVSNKFDPVESARLWNSFSAKKGGSDVTIAAIFAKAEEYGYVTKALPGGTTEAAAAPRSQVDVAGSGTSPYFSLFTSESETLTKVVTRQHDGVLKKEPAADMVSGAVEIVRLASFDAFGDVLTSLRPNQALGYGVPLNGGGPVLSTARWEKIGKPAGVITRAAENFTWCSGPSVMMIDYDPPSTGASLGRDDLLNKLYEIAPALRNAPHWWFPSASSCIFDATTGKQLSGVGGQRVWIHVADGNDIPRAGAALFERSWLHGHGRYDISKAGSLLERGLVDNSVWQTQRLDFAAGAVCEAGLEQRRGKPVRYGGTVPFDTRRIASLTKAQRDTVSTLRATAKDAQSVAASERRSVWLAARGESISKARGIPLVAAQDIARQAVDGGVLLNDFLLTQNNGCTVSVAELLNDPAAWHGQYFLDPIEPDADRKSAAWARLIGGEPALFAHGHGGTWYELGHSAKQERLDRFMRQCMAKADDNGAGTTPEHLTEMGNAVRFARQHGENARWIFEFHKWIFWDGQRWIFAEAGEEMRLAKSTVRNIYAEVAEVKDLKAMGVIEKHARSSQTRHGLQAMLALAQSEPGIALSQSALDTDPMLLGVSNGVVNLNTGMLRASSRSDHITKIAHVAFDEHAPCPAWRKFLSEIFGGDSDLIAYVQRAVGYSLTGSTAEQCLFFLYGMGSNGKSTFLGTLKALLGDYAAQCTPDSLMVKRDSSGGNASPDIARLRGARLVSAIEAEDGRRLAESLIKQMTGGDTIVSRFLYQEYFEFVPQFKLWLAANHKPAIRGTDQAIWRRIHLIPFTVTIAESKKDKRLPEKLVAEGPGILKWALEGCSEWQRLGGLNPPAAVIGATAAYRAEQDVFGAWLEDCCTIGQRLCCGARDLYTNYCEWCESERSHPLGNARFAGRLRELGFLQDRGNRGRSWLGVGLG